MLWCLASSFLLGLGGIIAYVYFLKRGQFEDPEDVKYQMFRDEESKELFNNKLDDSAEPKPRG